MIEQYGYPMQIQESFSSMLLRYLLIAFLVLVVGYILITFASEKFSLIITNFNPFKSSDLFNLGV